MDSGDNDFYKKEYKRLESFINDTLYKRISTIYHLNDFPIPLKHDGSNCSKIMYMLNEIEKKD